MYYQKTVKKDVPSGKSWRKKVGLFIPRFIPTVVGFSWRFKLQERLGIGEYVWFFPDSKTSGIVHFAEKKWLSDKSFNIDMYPAGSNSYLQKCHAECFYTILRQLIPTSKRGSSKVTGARQHRKFETNHQEELHP